MNTNWVLLDYYTLTFVHILLNIGELTNFVQISTSVLKNLQHLQMSHQQIPCAARTPCVSIQWVLIGANVGKVTQGILTFIVTILTNVVDLTRVVLTLNVITFRDRSSACVPRVSRAKQKSFAKVC